ncbi:hypothetical protein MJM99_32800, partial [Salmonella enterica subsp. enterica serovar Kentucky]|nr:hypothetical protein [Salmonella enterica subsp. enterica serovar Kentucky]
WVVGRFIPTLILVMMLIDLGAFVGVQGENKFGKATQDVKFKAGSLSSLIGYGLIVAVPIISNQVNVQVGAMANVAIMLCITIWAL